MNVAVEMDLLEDWVTWRDTAKEYNMSALLRNNKIAGKPTLLLRNMTAQHSLTALTAPTIALCSYTTRNS